MIESKEPKTLMKLISNNKIVPLTLVGVSEQTLERVLEHLQEKDELFDYNVPDKWRDPAKEGIQEFLVKTYLQENFEIAGETSVREHIQCYDFVEFDANNPASGYEFYLKQRMKGVIKEVDITREYPLTILWEQSDEFPEEKELTHTGKGLVLLPKGIFNRKKISSKVELLAEATPGRLVESTIAKSKYLYYLPVGTRGIVTKINKSAEFPVCVVFGNTEGYIPPNNGIINCKYRVLKVFRKNRIDIRKLIGELS